MYLVNWFKKKKQLHISSVNRLSSLVVVVAVVASVESVDSVLTSFKSMLVSGLFLLMLSSLHKNIKIFSFWILYNPGYFPPKGKYSFFESVVRKFFADPFRWSSRNTLHSNRPNMVDHFPCQILWIKYGLY